MKIATFDLHGLRNEEHYQFQTDFNSLVAQFTPAALKITDKLNGYTALFANEGEALDLIRKSLHTQTIAEADAQRDGTFSGFKSTIIGALHHFDPTRRDAANHLNTLFEHYGNVAVKPYDEETAAITSLVADLRGTFAADVTALAVTEWVDKLEADNNAFVALKNERYSEESVKTSLRMKNVRNQIDALYTGVVERINALINVEGEDNYKAFVNELNARINKYSLLLAQRKGVNAKARARETAAPKTAGK